MTNTRKVEIFSAGCPTCEETVKWVNQMACPSCEISVLDMNSPETVKYAQDLGIKSVPAVAIDGKLAACCKNQGVDKNELQKTGLGQSLN